MALRLRVGLALAGVAALAPVLETTAAPSQRARVIDRTMQCSTRPQAGVREVHVYARSGVRDQDDPSKWFAHAQLGLSGGDSAPRLDVFMQPRPEVPGGNDARARTYSAGYSACRAVRSTVPLSPRGLAGGRASQLGERFECVVPRRVFVRIRAEFRESVQASRTEVAVPLRSGRIAVRAASGRTIVYADVLESGRARLYLAANCVRD